MEGQVEGQAGRRTGAAHSFRRMEHQMVLHKPGLQAVAYTLDQAWQNRHQGKKARQIHSAVVLQEDLQELVNPTLVGGHH